MDLTNGKPFCDSFCLYLFICFFNYIRHYTNRNKTKGGGGEWGRTLSPWTCVMLPLTGFACFWTEHIQINHKEKMWKVKMLCKFSKLEIWYQLPVCCSTFGCAGGCELLPHIVLIMWTLSPVAPRLIDTTVDMPSGTKTFYHLLSTRLTHALSQRLSMFRTLSHVFTRSFMCNQVI